MKKKKSKKNKTNSNLVEKKWLKDQKEEIKKNLLKRKKR